MLREAEIDSKIRTAPRLQRAGGSFSTRNHLPPGANPKTRGYIPLIFLKIRGETPKSLFQAEKVLGGGVRLGGVGSSEYNGFVRLGSSLCTRATMYILSTLGRIRVESSPVLHHICQGDVSRLPLDNSYDEERRGYFSRYFAFVGDMLRSGFQALPTRIDCIAVGIHAHLGSLRCLIRSSVHLARSSTGEPFPGSDL